MTIQSGLKAKIIEAQKEAVKDLKAPSDGLRGLDAQLESKEDGAIYFVGRIWVPSTGGIRKEYGIVSQSTPPYTPQHNDMFEMRNQTLIGMVYSMMSQTTLPKSFEIMLLCLLHAFSI
uniref:Putative reverse transcriptase domain-containing protein n=1 Tax=Tanacetum cinerariifolium TaxID=118510 RepID=A0A699KL15_TANCI|nr:putative reverse transcriptase domain-containing protein [Tanacetum cinerariifolium]